ncbi:hypothetical protein L915_10347 [Phytophthora nicotianae]|uniref:Protein kinase domain-containing protein n=1 Tax=Phytophthora nicotianae TaxID=4792 RepID=W2GNY6_PHYNI|nr:hypothetical protein L915_10347 [Phytophthora nicotianae]
MAIAVAEALENLHSRTPAIIRRDLKSNYILLTKSLDPKLIDFGVSRVDMAEHDTISLRSLTSIPSSSSSSSFVFDGTNSDIARQLLIRHQAGDVAEQVNLTSIPTAVLDRLIPLNIDFDGLPGLVQRTVLWDIGFAISPAIC